MPQGLPYENRGTVSNFQIPQIKQFEQEQLKQRKKAECEARGGVWNGTTCILPQGTDQALVNQLASGQVKVSQPQANKQQENKTSAQLTTPEVFRDEKTGRLSGITLPNGKTFLGLSPDEVNAIVEGERQKQAIPQGAAPVGTAAAQAQALQQAQTVISQTNQVPNLTEQDLLNAVPQEPGFENLQAGAGGIAGAIGGGGAGAAFGGTLGTLTLPGIGTVAGATLGAIGGAIVGFVGGVYTPITVDKRSDVKQALKVAKTANTNFGQTIDALNAGIITPEMAMQRWNSDKVALYAAYANLKRDTSTDLERFLSGGADEMVQVEDYLKDFENVYTIEFQQALLAPNPQRLKYIYQNGEVLE